MHRVVLAIIALFSVGVLVAQPITVKQLTCENRVNPMGIDVAVPVFGWQIVTVKRNVKQSAYQLQVSTDSLFSQENATIWNSGQKKTDRSLSVIYTGKKLASGRRYYWRVQIWDNSNQSSGWSQVTSFTTGLYTPADWSNAQWIGYEAFADTMRVVPGVHQPDRKKMPQHKALQRPVVPLFRKEFTTTKKVVRALVFVSGLGQYEMSINHRKAGAGFLTPGWTHYDKRYLYNTYDVTDLLVNGPNAIGMIVGNGFFNVNRERYYKLAIAYGMPQLICKMQITYTDGTEQVIVSGKDWKTAPSPVSFSSIYGGEDYDARLEQQGWDSPQFNDANWKQALIVAAPQGKAEAEKDYPVQVNKVIEVKSIDVLTPATQVYDFGQNASGIVALKVKGKKGQSVRLSPGELLRDNKMVNQNNTGKPYYFSYTLKGDGEEVWYPRFTYYGFRYVQADLAADTINGEKELPVITGLQMLHTGNSAPASGSFTCSNELFNRIDTLIQWAIKSNVQSVVTDCPHREKLSWLEQDYLVGGSIQHNIQVYQLYKKLVQDMMDAQTTAGMVPDITPEYVFFDDHGFGFRDSPEWGSASVILPWLIYKWYGDNDVMRMAYPMMQKYVAYLKSRATDHILSYGLGDWYDLGPKFPGVAQLTPKEVTATAIYYYDITLLGKMAALLDRKADAAGYMQLAKEVKQAFNNKFFDAKTKVYSTGSQTAMAMPLCVGLVEAQYRKAVFNNLTDSIRAGDKKLTAGDIGFHFLVQALDEGGASQLLYEMNNREDVPGYGYQIKKGATALTESWSALKEVSNNHLMLGHIMEWFYTGLAGINQSAQSNGYKQIVIKPETVGDINAVKATYQSFYGPITSEWKKEGHTFTLQVNIPANTTATIYLPATASGTITESGKPVTKSMYKEGRAVIQTGSGNYKFEVKN